MMESVMQQCEEWFSEGKMSLEEIIRKILVISIPELYDSYASKPFEQTSKSDEKADRLRIDGDHYYGKKNFEKALELYNLSIMAAFHPVLDNEDLSFVRKFTKDEHFAYPLIDPARYGGTVDVQSTALAKGFANRSAVLFELQLYEKCVQDIDLALEYGYPKELVHKLESRKQKCIESSASNNASEPREENKSSGIASAFGVKKPQYMDYLSDYLEGMTFRFKLPDAEKTLSLKGRLTAKTKKPPTLAEYNACVPSFSSAVKVSYSSSKGRGVTAVKNINRGEVLGVERALCCGLQAERLTTHCSTCFGMCLTPLPCPGCSQVIFCSKSCRTRGLAEDHWLDCKMLPLMNSQEIVISAGNRYKMLKTFTFQSLKDVEKELSKDKPGRNKCLGFSKNGIFSSTSYQSMHHMCHDANKWSFKLFYAELVRSFDITRLLVLSGRYFINASGESYIPSTEDFLETCKDMFFNNLKKSKNSFNLAKGEGKCWGVFPGMSLLNHSCNPSAVFRSFGRVGYFFALRPITRGEEVMVSYVNSYEILGKQERMKLLKDHYNFVCTCEACEGNWPTRKANSPSMFKFQQH